ncbi:MAG: 4-alpha-glucanotransferase, partial [Thermoguttaceae bacterium]
EEDRIAYHIFLQLVFDVQWQQFRQYCREKNIGLIGDVPIYVGSSSAETWENSHLFQLDENGRMIRVAGVPADGFNPDGQRWNMPLYLWEKHKEENFAWWSSRIRTCLRRFDAVRLDHFIGFYNYFSMPKEVDPEDPGAWIPGPAEELFDSLLKEFPRTAFIAEDLGVLKAGVHALREKYEFPGMNVYQFSFDFRRNTDPTREWKPNSIVCTGTHDTPTLAAWWDEVIADRQKAEPFWDFPAIVEMMKPYLPDNASELTFTSECEKSREALRWGAIQMVMNSPGNVAIFPMQDLIGLGKDARMNFPGHADGNWLWRLESKYLTDELASKIRNLTEKAGRKRN